MCTVLEDELKISVLQLILKLDWHYDDSKFSVSAPHSLEIGFCCLLPLSHTQEVLALVQADPAAYAGLLPSFIAVWGGGEVC